MKKNKKILRKSFVVNCQRSRQRGFSLIEVMIVMAIIVIMTGILFAMNVKTGADSDVDAAAQQISAQLRELQNEALTGKQIGGTYACSYQLSYGAGATNYNVIYYSDCASNPIASIPPSLPAINLKNVTIQNAGSVTFVAPRGDTGGATTIITVTSNKNPSVLRKITVYPAGNISITTS